MNKNKRIRGPSGERKRPENQGKLPPGLLSSLVDFTPVAGDIKAVYDTKSALDKKDYLTAGLSAASLIPVVGDVGSKLGKGMLKGLPPAKNAQKTQLTTSTVPSYTKSYKVFDDVKADGPSLDFGAGKGYGAREVKVDHTYEPFPDADHITPDFSDVSEIPSNTYGKVTSLNVINVVPLATRNDIVLNIGRVLRPGGHAIVSSRGPSGVMEAAKSPNSRLGPEPNSVITSNSTYQKGYSQKELQAYVEGVLGDNYTVSSVPKTKIGDAAVLIKKRGPEAP